MRLANEISSYFDGPDEYLEDRKLFVRNVGILASQTREHVLTMELVHNNETRMEFVVITFRGGMQKRVNVTMDSYAAIVRDVFEELS